MWAYSINKYFPIVYDPNMAEVPLTARLVHSCGLGPQVFLKIETSLDPKPCFMWGLHDEDLNM